MGFLRCSVITNLLLRILPKCPEMCSCLLLEGLPHLLIPFCLKIYFFFSGCGLQKPPGCSCSCRQSDLELVRQKKGESTNPAFIPTLCAPVIVHYLPRDYFQKLSCSFPPSPHFYLMPGDVQSCTQGFLLHWALGSGSHLSRAASTGSILKPF